MPEGHLICFMEKSPLLFTNFEIPCGDDKMMWNFYCPLL